MQRTLAKVETQRRLWTERVGCHGERSFSPPPRTPVTSKSKVSACQVSLGPTGQKPRIRADPMLWGVSRCCLLLPWPQRTECNLPLRKPQRIKNQDSKRYTYPKFITAQYTIAKTRKQPKCLSTDEGIKKI